MLLVVATNFLVKSEIRIRIPILTYHDVIERRDKNSVWFDCTTREFAEQMNWFRAKGAEFISIKQVYEAIRFKRALPSKSICITFADNYQGFYRNAWPLLKKYKIPVAQFVHTDFVGSQTGRLKMNWTQLRELDRSGLVTIGSQTCSHPSDLSKLHREQVAYELRESKKKLEVMLGHKVDSFAYPNGKFSKSLSLEVKKAGYAIAFTEVQKPAEPTDNIMLVPRYVHTKWKQSWQDSINK
jgi:poly-beta-1,6-N-acetyl-D-glucosamine N-deacetylase